jgi:hypothetical protein
MEQSPSWEANRSSASEEISRILWNPKVHYRIYKRPPPIPVCRLISPIRASVPVSWRSVLILSSQVHLGLPSGLFHTVSPTKTLYAPLLSSIRATCPAHLVLLDVLIVPDVCLLPRSDVVSRRTTFHCFNLQDGRLIASRYCNFWYWAGIVVLLHW